MRNPRFPQPQRSQVLSTCAFYISQKTPPNPLCLRNPGSPSPVTLISSQAICPLDVEHTLCSDFPRVPRQRATKPLLGKIFPVLHWNRALTSAWHQSSSYELPGLLRTPSVTHRHIPPGAFPQRGQVVGEPKKPNLAHIRVVCHSLSGFVHPTKTPHLDFPHTFLPQTLKGRQAWLWTVVWAISASSSTGTQGHEPLQIPRGEHWGRCWENRVEVEVAKPGCKPAL